MASKQSTAGKSPSAPSPTPSSSSTSSPPPPPKKLSVRDERLFAAIKGGKIKDVRKALKGEGNRKPNVDTVDAEGVTPLVRAVGAIRVSPTWLHPQLTQ